MKPSKMFHGSCIVIWQRCKINWLPSTRHLLTSWSQVPKSFQSTGSKREEERRNWKAKLNTICIITEKSQTETRRSNELQMSIEHIKHTYL